MLFKMNPEFCLVNFENVKTGSWIFDPRTKYKNVVKSS